MSPSFLPTAVTGLFPAQQLSHSHVRLKEWGVENLPCLPSPGSCRPRAPASLGSHFQQLVFPVLRDVCSSPRPCIGSLLVLCTKQFWMLFPFVI